MDQRLIIESQYLPPVNTFSALKESTHINFDPYEAYRKMSFRNRCVVAGANGPISLSIPLELGRGQRTPISEVRIANRYPWQIQHWKTIESAYRKGPWFEFYAPELELFYRNTYSHLFDWNLELLRWVLEKLGMPVLIEKNNLNSSISDQSAIVDLRNRFLPNSFQQFPAKPYQQVFSERGGFQANLSVIDLLFCAGKQAVEYL